MLDVLHIPEATGRSEVTWFFGTALTDGAAWQVWQKPRGITMVDILIVGKGGNGGAGAIGANSAAAGGGGGASGGQTRLTVPAYLLPDCLYLSLLGSGILGANAISRISVYPDTKAANCLAAALAGTNGGNASGATAGAAGAAASTVGGGTMPLGTGFATAIGGQAGIIGGVAVNSANSAMPTTGLIVMGGTGGGGLPAAGVVGTNGGGIPAAGIFPVHNNAQGAQLATAPPDNGKHGYRHSRDALKHYPGLGGGSTHGTATGAGLVQSSGGHGAPGCGGGGSGGALTGSTPGSTGNGGPAFAIITAW